MKKIDIACIIDDDPIFVFGAKRMMELANFCNGFMVFQDGKKALEGLAAIIASGNNLPELILLDLNMPVMDGWQFLDEFTKIKTDKKITLYIVSSSIDNEDFNKAETYEVVSNYIVKPITMDTLKGILEDF
ncbi:response regulator receiver domain-containing protein [Roseivirga ehrenbergii]|uniref:Transcriptional regulator n=1 Tax=Roseivirga ehrenbergii (strain DSM 102268 / JCM 13514 / KCTC 12282 / NCIMB 14502 / KMM 6017) TaxID=279360 RepID=A0A150WYM2_ROSEK|nr:response regulator [Roseivirga ehrenbergii]KYG71585.1 transcriptional regulator [Roseivirga ehrenbergii]TCL07728.1 response regulator receiver domain-containing protein [Roseivirga ehrenbergii]